MGTHPVAEFGTQTKKKTRKPWKAKKISIWMKKKHRIRANKYRFKNTKRARVWVGCDERENSEKVASGTARDFPVPPGRLGGPQAPGMRRRAAGTIGAVPLRRVVSIGIGGSPLRGDHRRGIGATLRRWRALLPPAAPATTSPKPPQKKTFLV